jgi:hypothetical protein
VIPRPFGGRIFGPNGPGARSGTAHPPSSGHQPDLGTPSYVRPEDVADSIPCGDSAEAVAEAAKAFFKAGFTDLALVQIGGTEPEQDRFLEAAPELITALKETAG